MKHITLTESKANEIRRALSNAGYSEKVLVKYHRYFKNQGDHAVIHHSLNVVRSMKNTESSSIMKEFLGAPNGKATEARDDDYVTWFLNGYSGKAGTKI